MPDGKLAGKFLPCFPALLGRIQPLTPPDRRDPPGTSKCTKIGPEDELEEHDAANEKSSQTAFKYLAQKTNWVPEANLVGYTKWS